MPADPQDTASFTISRTVGRRFEARVFSLSTRRDADAYSEALAAEVDRLPHGEFGVLCADHRFAPVYPQPVTDRLIELFQYMNERLDRIAILVRPEAATLYMQLARIAREAGNKARRVFRDVDPALRHLTASLTEQEITRARTFLRTKS
jgi:hypothetical protein